MGNKNTWNTLMDISRLVDTAYGLMVLADYECADRLSIPAERVAAERAPMSAARMLLAQAKDLVDRLEPVLRNSEQEAA